MRKLDQPIDWIDLRKATEQLILRVIMNASSFVSYSFSAYLLTDTSSGRITIAILIGIEMRIIFKRVKSFKNFYQIPIDSLNSRSIILILIKHFFGFLFTASSVNALLGCLINGFYKGIEGLGSSEMCVEILHYTFGLMVTYSSGNGIIAVHPLAKIIEMMEILLFYVFIGFLGLNMANEALSKLRESS